jgi:dTMP kinase
MSTAGKFITLEGVDGAGKSTHLGFVADWLRQHGREVVVTREPGGTTLGETLGIAVASRDGCRYRVADDVAAARQEIGALIRPARRAWVVGLSHRRQRLPVRRARIAGARRR